MNVLILLGFALLPSLMYAQSGVDADWIGSWSGIARADQEQTRIRLNIRSLQAGVEADIDLLDIGVLGIPVQNAEINEEVLTFAIPSDNGSQAVSLVRESDNSLSGFWREPDKSDAVLNLEKAAFTPDSSEQRISVSGSAGNLGVSIISPQNSQLRAGVVFVHGSGPETRNASRFAAITLAEAGIASVIFDKRGTGESAGDWRNADFADLATDVLTVTETLMEMTGLDPTQIGFIGTSQGGWVAPLAASQMENPGFLITISGPATTPREEGHWNVIRELRLSGFDESIIAQANALIDLWDEGVLAGGDFTEFTQALDAVRDENWLSQSNLERIHTTELPDWFIGWYQQIMNFDPAPVVESLQIPMLVIMGDEDEEQPWDRSIEIFEGMIAEGNDITIHLYPNANHAIRMINPDGNFPRWPGRPQDFFDRQIDFIISSVDAN